MRHIWSLVAGVVVAPLAWFLVALGHGAMIERVTLSSSESDFVLGGLLLIGVGLLLGLIGSLRTSPVAALFTAAVYLGFTVVMILSPGTTSDSLGGIKHVGSYDVVLTTPLTSGVLAVIGGMLLIAVFSPARWRGSLEPADPNAWTPPPPPEPWKPPTVSTPTSDAGTDKSF